MRKILITGGAGFLGSNLISALLASKNFQIICLDNYDTFYDRRIKERNIQSFFSNEHFVFIEGDIRRAEDLRDIQSPDVIIHLAAKAGVRQSILNPEEYEDVNIKGTQNMLEFAKERNVKQFLFASSSSVYGSNPNLPWNENEKPMPISPYAWSKISGELLGHVYSHLYGVRFLSLRFFSIFGPSQRPDLAIFKFFDLITDRKPIPAYGTGNTFRDYTFVGDVVNGIIAALDYTLSKYEIINIAAGTPVTLNQLIQAIEKTCEMKAIIDRMPEQVGDASATFADITKAKILLNYSPSNRLDNNLKIFYDWFLECKKSI